MSYILDALRRADAERQRGHVPGLHAQGSSAGPVAGAPPAWRAGAIGLGVGGALALLALVLLAWRSWPENDPAAVPVPVPPSVAAVAPAVIAEPAPAAPVQAPALTPSVQPVAPPLPSRKRVAPAVALPAVPRAIPASAPAAPLSVSTLAELPDDIRRQLPALVIGGSAYSTSPASRFVIVNGQLFHEGDALAPGLVLEQIRLKSAVLMFKGYRYGINF